MLFAAVYRALMKIQTVLKTSCMIYSNYYNWLFQFINYKLCCHNVTLWQIAKNYNYTELPDFAVYISSIFPVMFMTLLAAWQWYADAVTTNLHFFICCVVRLDVKSCCLSCTCYRPAHNSKWSEVVVSASQYCLSKKVKRQVERTCARSWRCLAATTGLPIS